MGVALRGRRPLAGCQEPVLAPPPAWGPCSSCSRAPGRMGSRISLGRERDTFRKDTSKLRHFPPEREVPAFTLSRARSAHSELTPLQGVHNPHHRSCTPASSRCCIIRAAPNPPVPVVSAAPPGCSPAQPCALKPTYPRPASAHLRRRLFPDSAALPSSNPRRVLSAHTCG